MSARFARFVAAGLALLGLTTCLTSPDPPADTACLQGTEPLFARYEAIGQANDCRNDSQCVMGGCSSEVCAAVPVVTTCEVVPTPQRDFGCRACGCVQGTCRWVR
jgi:eight-cysteine-cluster-containing protein